MKEFFTISEAAKEVGVTAETLRHYDRIGLVKPGRTDEWTGYRYYSRQELVVLDTVKMLRCMDMSLSEIKRILSYDDFGKITDALKAAESKADERIAELNDAKTRIRRAIAQYEGRGGEKTQAEPYVARLPRRVILLSDTLERPTMDDLRGYHRHFYAQLPDGMRDKFSFEDAAGIYERNGTSRMFAVCSSYAPVKGIVVLPEGRYLCAGCEEEDAARVTAELLRTAETDYAVIPTFAVRMIVVSGILQWTYLAQVLIEDGGAGQ